MSNKINIEKVFNPIKWEGSEKASLTNMSQMRSLLEVYESWQTIAKMQNYEIDLDELQSLLKSIKNHRKSIVEAYDGVIDALESLEHTELVKGLKTRKHFDFNRIDPCYTGGGIYTYVGQTKDGHYFIASDCDYDVRFVTANVFEVDDDDLWDVDWQEAHLEKDFGQKETLEFFKDALTWIIDNEPNNDSCNYNLGDMKNVLEEVESIMKTNPNNYR